MVSRKEAHEYFQKHSKIHPDIIALEIIKVKALTSNLPELADPEPEPEPEPEESF
tara:strand:- start:836 stop:1000 length:165 start_codon:yes stop_codon:yes gene_type:complete